MQFYCEGFLFQFNKHESIVLQILTIYAKDKNISKIERKKNPQHLRIILIC